MLKVYTDGSFCEELKTGGYAVLFVKKGEKGHAIQCRYTNTTNERMELRAVIEAIKHITEDAIVFGDCMDIINAINKKRIYRWEKENFSGRKDIDLWKELISLLRVHPYSIAFKYVKSHQNTRYCSEDGLYNQKVDKLASYRNEKIPVIEETAIADRRW